MLSNEPANARNILYKNTNDGSQLALETNHMPISRDGWTVFYYLVFPSSKSGSVSEHVAATPYCNNGSVDHAFDFEPSTLPVPEWATPQQTEEIGQLSAYTTKRSAFMENRSDRPQWAVILHGRPFIVTADSKASEDLIQVVCRIGS